MRSVPFPPSLQPQSCHAIFRESLATKCMVGVWSNVLVYIYVFKYRVTPVYISG